MNRMQLKMTMTPEQELYVDPPSDEEMLRYRHMCKTSPRSVVAILRNGQADGLTGHVNVFATLVAVSELTNDATDIPRSRRLKTWYQLIDLGVVDILVDAVVNAVIDVDVVLRDVPEPLQGKARNEMMAPYFLPLEVLSNAARYLSQPDELTPQDRKFLSTVKGNFTKMMNRVWDEPCNTLTSTGRYHELERSVVLILLRCCFTRDPSSIDVVARPDDRTIAVITRSLANAGSDAENLDAYTASSLLLDLAFPKDPGYLQYREAHPEFTLELVFKKMCEGVAGPGMSEAEQADALLTSFGSRLAIFNGMEADLLARLTIALFRAPLPRLNEAAIHNETFWRGMFLLMIRAHQGKEVGFLVQATKKKTMMSGLRALSLVGSSAPIEDRNALYCTCVRAGIFDALDEAVEGIFALNRRARPNKYHCDLSRDIFAPMLEALKAGDEETRNLFRGQFSRQKTLAALFLHDLKTDVAGGVSQSFDSSSYMYWQVFCKLQVAAKPRDLCWRRGCMARGQVRCEVCKAVMYCGPKCATKDWDEHRTLCVKGWMHLVNDMLPLPESLRGRVWPLLTLSLIVLVVAVMIVYIPK